jgi:hypothetical protein
VTNNRRIYTFLVAKDRGNVSLMSDTITPAWMVHFGVPLGTHPARRGEGRLFFDHIGRRPQQLSVLGGRPGALPVVKVT